MLGDRNHPRKRISAFSRRIVACLIASLLLLLAGAVCAQTSNTDKHAGTPGMLRVGVYVSAPFVMTDGAGHYTGMGIDLWETAARDLGWHFQYVKMQTVKQLMQALENGSIDVGVTNLTVNKKRAKLINFTQPWYRGGLRIMIYDKEQAKTGFDGLIAGLHRAGYLLGYAWILGVIVIATFLLTLFDRHFDENFPRRWRDGIAESFYTTMSVVTSGKPPSRKNLFGWLGRIWQGIWLVCGIAVLAFVTSSVTSVMTTMSLTNRINSVADLANKTVGVREGSTGDQYATLVGLDIRQYQNLGEAVPAMRKGKVDALIGDAAVLQHYAYTHEASGAVVVGHMFSPQNYAFGLPKYSDMTKPLTVELLGLKKSGYLKSLHKKYLGKP